MANKIVINSGIKKYAIENEDGKVIAELIIDSNDTSTMDRFINLYESATKIEEDFQETVKEKGLTDDAITTKAAKEVLQLNNEAINRIIDETEEMFGDGFIHRIFADNYAINKNFIPSIQVIVELYQQIIPILTEVFKGMGKSPKYSVKRNHE